MSFLTEFNKELDIKIFYKTEQHVSAINLKDDNSYKIKELYTDQFFKEKLMYIFTSKVQSLFCKKTIEDYLHNNYDKPDKEIYNALREYTVIKEDRDEKQVSVQKHLNIVCYSEEITDIGQYFLLTPNKKVLPYESNTFDLIMAFTVLHHIQPENLDFVLDEITRVMNTGGILTIEEYMINPLIRLNTHLLDVLHSYYDMINNREKIWTSVNNYNTESYWVKKIIEKGFEKQSSELKKNPYDCKVISFIKI